MRRSLTAVSLVTALALAGCASTASPGSSEAPAASASESAAAGATVDNCGFEATFDAAPERVVTIKSSTTEALVALGLEDRIVGTAFQDGPLPDTLSTDADLPVIDERMPGAESVLALEPDLVFSGWESAFAADAVGTRDELAELGVGTYVWPTACMSADAPTEVTFDDIAAEVEQLADVFDVDASEVLADQRETVDAIVADDRDLTTLWWSSGTETPYVGAGQGAPQLIMDTAGLTNVAADLEGGWSPYGWESVLAADPDVLVIVDSDWNTAEHKIEYLEADPTLSQLTAVQQHRYVIVPFAASEAGVRTAEAAQSVALQVSEIAL
ncbi:MULTISPECIES: putative F420-0 ABC transporter substrate-binding protein [unclassified Agrococcus]|uniref:putative F420-0 ABC transporter substrate-binding protein n=1 Tax=unclassified Agrococcus TaxID=2615065 RepID=UPI00362138EF